MARSRTLRVCHPHHDGIARHCSRTVGIAAVGEARRRVDRRDAAREEPLAQRGAAGLLDVGDHLVVEQRPDLDEVAVGVDDRMVDLGPDLSGPGRGGRRTSRHGLRN